MNTKKGRQARVCECGARFWTSVKFGNEEKCDACYEARKVEYLKDFRTFSPEIKRQQLAIALKFLADLLVAKAKEEQPEPISPEEESHADQDAIDAAFSELMGSVNWGEE